MSGHFEEHMAALEKIVFRDLGCREHVGHQRLEDVGDEVAARRRHQPTEI
jgi:hypothetical protein